MSPHGRWLTRQKNREEEPDGWGDVAVGMLGGRVEDRAGAAGSPMVADHEQGREPGREA